MKKVYIIFLLSLFLIGCENKEEELKTEYVVAKNNLKEEKEYTKKEELPLDITVEIDRENEEKLTYRVILNNPKENMKEIKAIVIHNYYSEELFPSIGIFDEKKSLLTSDIESKIELSNTIKTTKNLSKLNLELKIWIEYKNDRGETKEIYYKTT